MGMYTEFVFQGRAKNNLPLNVKNLFDYFFNKDSELINEDTSKIDLPEHNFFYCSNWAVIGHVSSYYFNPFSLRYSQKNPVEDNGDHVFFVCNLKNYDSEIELFLNWIDEYMDEYWGYHWYEEDDVPTFFKVRR